MTYLIDTHVFLWSVLSANKLSRTVKAILLDPQLTKYVSIVTFWEISLKFALGKITLQGVLPDQLPGIARKTGFDILILNEQVASSFYKLAKIKHKDPFDRMLAWQAISQNCVLLTQDQEFSDYKDLGLNTVW